MKKPVILGGKPYFDTVVPINRPTLPAISELTGELEGIFNSGMITNSKYVRRLEDECASYLKTEHAVAVSCCTSGLMLTIKALGLSGEVIVPSFTFPATVHALVWNNVTPVFVDCDPQTFNLNSDLIEEKITPKTTGILATYIFGNPPEMDKLQTIATRHGLKLIFDAAHAFGARYNGISAGNHGDAEVFSLAPTKIIVAGEGGIIATKNSELAKELEMAREYGNPGDYNCRSIGLNARMSEIHALLGLKSLGMLEENIQKRCRLVERYRSGLQDIPGISFQKILPNAKTSNNYFSILIDKEEFVLTNDELSIALDGENIMTRKYFFPPVHEQVAYSDYFSQYDGELPVTDSVCRRVCCLPLFSHMGEEVVACICQAIEDVYKYREDIKERISRRM